MTLVQPTSGAVTAGTFSIFIKFIFMPSQIIKMKPAGVFFFRLIFHPRSRRKVQDVEARRYL